MTLRRITRIFASLAFHLVPLQLVLEDESRVPLATRVGTGISSHGTRTLK